VVDNRKQKGHIVPKPALKLANEKALSPDMDSLA